jgi:hypothetical protein
MRKPSLVRKPANYNVLIGWRWTICLITAVVWHDHRLENRGNFKEQKTERGDGHVMLFFCIPSCYSKAEEAIVVDISCQQFWQYDIGLKMSLMSPFLLLLSHSPMSRPVLLSPMLPDRELLTTDKDRFRKRRQPYPTLIHLSTRNFLFRSD